MVLSRFENKTVVVTGAGTGMGRAAAIRLAQEGARTVLVGRRPEPLAQLADEIGAQGGVTSVIACDIGDDAAVRAMFRQAAAPNGRLDGLFANAGILGALKPLAETGVADFNALIATNLIGTFLTLKHGLPLLEGGAIVVNASWTIHGVMPGAGAYAASKSALMALVRTLAVEQGPGNIRINAISPGIILMPMASAALDSRTAAQLAAHAALRRNGTPEDVAGTIAWLLSEDARFVTG